MSLYKVLDNPLVEHENGGTVGYFFRPKWVDGVGMCCYYYSSPRNDHYYGVSSIEGQVFKVNETLSYLESRDFIYDELRNSLLIEQYGGNHYLEYDAVNGLFLVNGWNTEDYAEYSNFYYHARLRSRGYGMDPAGYVHSYEHGIREGVWYPEDSPRVRREGRCPAEMRGSSRATDWYPMRDGNYLVANVWLGVLMAYNPSEQEFFGPMYTVEAAGTDPYYCICYSKDLNLVIAAKRTNSSYSRGSIQAYALETVPNTISSPETVDGNPIRGGESQEIKVTVTGDRGEGAASEQVSWGIGFGGGTLLYPRSTTDDDGVATNVYYPPATPPPYDVQIDASVKV